jgi:beta-phosphoglucomutase family hydrolase
LNIDLSHYKGLIFDMDGTLVDTMPTHLEAWRLTAEHHEFEFSYEWFYELGGVPTLETIVMVNEAQDLRLEPLGVSITKQQIFESICSKIDLIDETHSLLMQHRPDKKIAIGTGSDKKGADRTLAASGLIGLLDAVVCSDDVANHKPSPDTFLLAAERLGLKPHECVVFEDTRTGLEAARSAGMDCYLVVDGKVREFFASETRLKSFEK